MKKCNIKILVIVGLLISAIGSGLGFYIASSIQESRRAAQLKEEMDKKAKQETIAATRLENCRRIALVFNIKKYEIKDYWGDGNIRCYADGWAVTPSIRIESNEDWWFEYKSIDNLITTYRLMQKYKKDK